MGALTALAGAALVAASPSPPTVAVVGSGGNRALVRVEPRTLEPLRGFARVRLSRRALFALSPNSERVAISTPREVRFVDTATGRVLREIGNDGFDAGYGVYWVGSNAKPLVIAVGEGKFGYEYTALPSDYATVDTNVDPETAVRGFLVLSDGTGVDFFGRAETWFPLDAAPNGYYEAVADVRHDDVYVLYSGGVAAEVRDTPVYHTLPISGIFETTWAGHGRIALWGADGLGVVDIRTWTAASLDATDTGAVGTPFGLVAWSSTDPHGVIVYNRWNRVRLHVLDGSKVQAVTALGRYAYARVGSRQYAIDVKTGRVRRIRADAELVVPTLVSLP